MSTHVSNSEADALGTCSLGCGHLNWTLRISSGVSEGVYKSVEQSDGEFLNIGVGDRQ